MNIALSSLGSIVHTRTIFPGIAIFC